ncbi:hypothetical protein EE612_052286, partial [Oryza sativa]
MVCAEDRGRTAAENPIRADPKSQSLADMAASRSTFDALTSPCTTAGSHRSCRYSSARATCSATDARRAHGIVPAAFPPPCSRSCRFPKRPRRGSRENGSTQPTLLLAEGEEADDVRMADAEERVELLAEHAVEPLAAAVDLDGGERAGDAGEVHRAEPALADHRRREPARHRL